MDLKLELVLPNDDLPFKMFIFEGRNGNYRVTKHWHDSVEIFLVFEGEIDFYINTSHYGLSRGMFIIVNSNEVHSIDVPKENFTVVLQIPQEEFDKYKDEEYLLFRHTSEGYKEEDAQFVRLIRRMYTAYAEKRYGYELEVLSDYYKMLHVLMTRYRERDVDKERVKQSRQIEKLFKITSYIQEHFREDMTLEHVAETFGFSPTYLSRIFKKYANVNYKTYVLNVRVEHGFKELLNTDISVNKIAENNGFPDSRSFSKAFAARFGISPDKYRREMRKRQESDMK
ncbi:AraC family transcriptional regulator [Kineothrix sp. MB12-C1]|uniref:AraC family transcriptional regulator n=1 Tax=Kineothrix sp. MB12-C1 TaxID=3070215 RepID=UPI0027D33733|nr:AraC family transcriptional regulator [Kineothrix sp. MB12-C1]WMC91825.1 AraC family transcriptional regulator [Kineothrix sp. MB12-C1]